MVKTTEATSIVGGQSSMVKTAEAASAVNGQWSKPRKQRQSSAVNRQWSKQRKQRQSSFVKTAYTATFIHSLKLKHRHDQITKRGKSLPDQFY
jgi:hypothetical protein